jgi:ATP-binding cassette, subfamily G (WHITE), member 2, SNQ2
LRQSLTWDKVPYSVRLGNGETKKLIEDISGFTESGTMTALMGASGAGKSTLLDALSMRTIGASTMDGSILLNGKPTDADFRRRTAYCEQMDTHEATQTVREALRLSAYLRQSPQVSREGKDNSVEELIQLLEMEDFADASIGDQESGLSVDERKKVTIGAELAAKPDLICQALTP